MAFNVCNSKGEHFGITLRPYVPNKPVYLVALTSLTMDDLAADFNLMENELAFYFDCKSLLGKVNSDKLDENLRERLAEFNSLDYKTLLKLGFLDRLMDMTTFVQKIPAKEDIRGYILMDTSKMKLMDDNIVIEEVVEGSAAIQGEAPLFGRIADYPRIVADARFYGMTEVGQWQSTTLTIESGNAIIKERFEIRMDVRKDMEIQVYFENEKPSRVFCDGVVYSFG